MKSVCYIRVKFLTLYHIVVLVGRAGKLLIYLLFQVYKSCTWSLHLSQVFGTSWQMIGLISIGTSSMTSVVSSESSFLTLFICNRRTEGVAESRLLFLHPQCLSLVTDHATFCLGKILFCFLYFLNHDAFDFWKL